MRPQLRVGGVLLTNKWWGGLKVTTQWPRGGWQADWSMALGPTERPPFLAQGAPMEVLIGSRPIFPGYVSETGWDTNTFAAAGAARESEGALCETSSGFTTSTPNTAIDTAIANGWVSWSRPASLSSTALSAGDTTEQQNYLDDLLDTWSNTVNKRWAVNPDRQVYAATDPTVPTYYIAYGAAEFGVADDKLIGTISGGWFDANGNPHVTKRGSGRPVVAVNMAKLGLIASAKATSVLDSILAKTGARLAFTNSITVDRSQVTTPGGVHPELWQITAGQVYRLNGLTDPRNGLPYTDVLMGESVWDVDAETVQLTPIDLAARDLSSIIADAGLDLL